MAIKPQQDELRIYYFVRYTAHHNEERHRSMIGHLFLNYPDSPKNIIMAIKDHVKKGEPKDGKKPNPKEYTIIIDAMSVISAIPS